MFNENRWKRFEEEVPRWKRNVAVVGKDKIIRMIDVNSYDYCDELPGIDKDNMEWWLSIPDIPFIDNINPGKRDKVKAIEMPDLTKALMGK